MSKKSLFIGAVASIIAINSVLADTVVTSRNYVDTQDALKQDKITAGTTGNVVTYNGTQNGQAQFSERAIFDPDTNFDYENNEVVSGHEGDLVTADIYPAVVDIYNQMDDIYNQIQQATNLPTITTSKMTCVDLPDCTLWTMADQTVYGQCWASGAQCQSRAECATNCCNGTYGCSANGNNCTCGGPE